MSLENLPSFFLKFSESDMQGENGHVYEFKSFRLDLAERRLLSGETPVPLTPKAFDVLAILVERAGHLVEKEELMHLVWPDSFVEETNVARIVHTLRKVLGEDQNGNKFIETVAKKGYRFVADVIDQPAPIYPSPDDNNAGPEGLDVEADEQITEKEGFLAGHGSSRRLVLASLTVLLAISLISFLAFRWNGGGSATGHVVSVAILPLKALNNEDRYATYKLGVADALIARLIPSKGLVVRSLSATQNYLDVDKDAATIGKEQQVDFVLASSYQIVDEKIRVTSQLINTTSGTVEGTFKSDQVLGGALETEDAIAADIGALILKRFNTAATDRTHNRGTNNDEAYNLYLVATALADKRNPADARKAVEYYEHAVELDPNFALAYAGLANAHNASAAFGDSSPEEYLKAKKSVERALEIDDHLAAAYSYLGEMKLNYEWDFDGAERAHRRAIELDPNSPYVHRMYAIYLNSMGQFDRSIAEIKTAIDLEPTSVLSQRIYGMILFYARRYDESIAQLERTIEMDPNFGSSYHWIAFSYRMNGENDKAFEMFLNIPQVKKAGSERIILLKDIYARAGWPGIFQQQLEEAQEEEKSGRAKYWNLAEICVELGDREPAIQYLERDFNRGERGWNWTTIKIDPRNDLIRSDPRFEEIVRRVGLK